MLLADEVKRVVACAFAEDEAFHDITTKACVDPSIMSEAKILLKEDAIVAGLVFLPEIFHALDKTLIVELFFQEGQRAQKGDILAIIKGKASSLLTAERTALNLLQHLFGIATYTAACVKEVEGLKCDILDTRKTLPGLRALQKYAVKIGGGKNHRFDLKERFLIKNNHLKLMQGTSPVKEAILKAKMLHPENLVQIEVQTLEELKSALEAKAPMILLDNMSVPLVTEAVKITKKQAYLEASGNMTKGKLRPYAEAGVDGISLGSLTHTVAGIDMSMRV